MYQVTNKTFQPFRIIVGIHDKILPARKTVLVKEITKQLKKMEKMELIKIKPEKKIAKPKKRRRKRKITKTI